MLDGDAREGKNMSQVGVPQGVWSMLASLVVMMTEVKNHLEMMNTSVSLM